MIFNNVFFTSHWLGFAGDTICCFWNIHTGNIDDYRLTSIGRARSSSGMLLNWAWYYPKWFKEQKPNPTLHNALPLYNNSCPLFYQTHFSMHENELLEKFPGSKVITILAKDPECAVTYHNLGHYKLLDQKLFTAWYDRQKTNYPLTQDVNKVLADRCYEQGMTVGEYRAIAHMDWLGTSIKDINTDPVTFWEQQPYCANFQENLNTVIINNSTWFPYFDRQRQIPLYVDMLANPHTKQINVEYYVWLCELFDITPNVAFYREFWNRWLDRQTGLNYIATPSWNFKP